MPKIQTYEGGSVNLQPQQMAQPARSNAGEMMQETAKTLNTIALQFKEIQDLRETTEASQFLRNSHLDVASQFSVDDPKNVDKYVSRLDEVRDEALSKISDPIARLKAQDSFNATTLSSSVKLQTAAREKLIDLQNYNAEVEWSTYSDDLRGAESPEQVNQILFAAETFGKEQVRTGLWTPDHATSRVTQLKKDSFYNVVRDIIYSDPSKANEVLSQYSDNLTNEEKTKLNNEASNVFKQAEESATRGYTMTFKQLSSDFQNEIDRGKFDYRVAEKVIDEAENNGKLLKQGGITKTHADALRSVYLEEYTPNAAVSATIYVDIKEKLKNLSENGGTLKDLVEIENQFMQSMKDRDIAKTEVKKIAAEIQKTALIIKDAQWTKNNWNPFTWGALTPEKKKALWDRHDALLESGLKDQEAWLQAEGEMIQSDISKAMNQPADLKAKYNELRSQGVSAEAAKKVLGLK